MICFADTDIVLKLAACDLLPATLAVLGVTRQEVFVLREEAYRVYKHDLDVLRQYTAETRKRALHFINQLHGIFIEADPEEQAYMEYAGIDPGEQVIFSATREHTEFQVITADRKALRALAHANGCGGICNRMNGRVVCLEQILLLLIPHLGYEALRTKILPCIAYDVAFHSAFGSDQTNGQKQAEALLRERIFNLREQTGNLLIW